MTWEELTGLTVWGQDWDTQEGTKELSPNTLIHSHPFYFLLEKGHGHLSLLFILTLTIWTPWSTILWATPFEFQSDRLDVRRLRKTKTKSVTVSFSWPSCSKNPNSFRVLWLLLLTEKVLFSNIVRVLAQCLTLFWVLASSQGQKIGRIFQIKI